MKWLYYEVIRGGQELIGNSFRDRNLVTIALSPEDCYQAALY